MSSELTLSHALLPPGARVLCAVSGGADSVCLLSLCRERGDLAVLCAHLDHGIRGEESRADARFTEELCRSWGIPFYMGYEDIPARAGEEGLGIEECARKYRYAFLRRIADETHADCIATAHTRNDNAETVLLRLARGTGLRGLAGIPEKRDALVRPLLKYSRRQVEAYLRERGIPWREDLTNRSDDYARNRVRHRVLPELEALNPEAAAAISRLTVTAGEDEAFLSSLSEAFLREQGEALSCAALLALPKSLSRRVLRLWLGRELSFDHTEALLRLCSGGGERAVLDLPGVRVRRELGTLFIGSGEPSRLPVRELPAEGELCLPEAGLKISCRREIAAEIQNSFTTFFFAYDKICGKLMVTPRTAGDVILLRGRDGTRSLKKLLLEKRIPPSRRDTVPVVRDEKGILCVYGIGCAARAVPQRGEPCVRIDFSEI